MALKLHFLARARLWSEVVVTGGERVFVPTGEVFMPGTQVSIEVDAPEFDAPLMISAHVLTLKPLGPGQLAGVVVKVEAASLEKLRGLVADHDEDARIAGRTEPRVDCELAVRVLTPQSMDGAAKSLSVHGLTLKATGTLTKDEELGLALTLPDATEALVTAQVMWTRDELKLSGLKLVKLDAVTERRLAAAIETLSGRAATGPATAKLVLVADDDPSILDFTSRVVTKAGHRVVRADRGDVALELIRKERPALIILDVLMPGLDGLEVCKAVRADASLAKTPVLLLSAMGEDRLAAAAKSSGADGYLTKPMRLDAMRAVLAEKLK